MAHRHFNSPSFVYLKASSILSQNKQSYISTSPYNNSNTDNDKNLVYLYITLNADVQLKVDQKGKARLISIFSIIQTVKAGTHDPSDFWDFKQEVSDKLHTANASNKSDI